MGRLTGIPNVFVGHATDATIRSGCTVIIAPHGVTAGVDVRGAAPGTRETDLLRPGNLVDWVQAVLLAGGSAFGLAAADGVVRWLFEHGHGFPTSVVNVPIVSGAVLFDLGVGEVAWPDAAMGHAACEAAMRDEAIVRGRVGAGTGATVGKLMGPDHASPGGIGMASITLPNGAIITAIVAVNAVGHVVDPATGRIVAGPRHSDGSYADSIDLLLTTQPRVGPGENTTIGCIVTTARLDKTACCRIAAIAHNGLARAIRPVHTQYDGDTLFVLSDALRETPDADIVQIGVAATEVVTEAVLNAVQPN